VYHEGVRVPLRLSLLLPALLLLPGTGPRPSPARADDGPPAGRPAREFFRGSVASFEGRRIRIDYDFAADAQREDWSPTYPFLRPPANGGWRVEKGALRGEGSAGLRHRGVFDGELKITATLSSEDARNFGALVLDEDKAVFDLFALADTQFALLDRKPPLMHIVATFQPPGQGPGGSTEWREVQSGYEPRLGGLPIDIQVRKKGGANEFRFAGSGRLAGDDKGTRVGPRLAPGFFTLGSKVVIAKVSVFGVLDARWLKENGIAFEDRVPPDTDPPLVEKDAGGASPPPGPDAAAGAWTGLLKKISDPRAPKAEREKAADDLVATKERRALRPLIDLLYDEEDGVGREVAIRAFKGIAGKDPGYRHDAPREARLKAMPRVWDLWYAVKDALDKEDRKKER